MRIIAKDRLHHIGHLDNCLKPHECKKVLVIIVYFYNKIKYISYLLTLFYPE